LHAELGHDLLAIEGDRELGDAEESRDLSVGQSLAK